MKLVVGLGNPGKRYDGTRHNVGYAVIDALAAGPGVSGFQDRFDADIAEWRDDQEKVLLVKPRTFMNLSGRAVRQAMDFYQVPLADLGDCLPRGGVNPGESHGKAPCHQEKRPEPGHQQANEAEHMTPWR